MIVQSSQVNQVSRKSSRWRRFPSFSIKMTEELERELVKAMSSENLSCQFARIHIKSSKWHKYSSSMSAVFGSIVLHRVESLRELWALSMSIAWKASDDHITMMAVVNAVQTLTAAFVHHVVRARYRRHTSGTREIVDEIPSKQTTYHLDCVVNWFMFRTEVKDTL